MTFEEPKLKKRVGRPSLNNKKGRKVVVRLDQELDNRLNSFISSHNLKLSEALRKAIVEMIENDKQ